MQKLLLFFFLSSALFGITAIKPVEIGERAGTHGNVALALETKKGSVDKNNYKGALKVIYDNNVTYVLWGELSGEYGKTNDVEDTNKAYTHIRYIRALTPKIIRMEALAQLQKDKYKLINQRSLLGIGLRFKVFELFKHSKGYFGIGEFYEHITYTSDDPTEDNQRINSYLTYSATLRDGASFTYTFYYQPLIENFNDYIQSHKFQLKLQIYKKLSLVFDTSYTEDSKPPMDVNRYDFIQTTALSFDF